MNNKIISLNQLHVLGQLFKTVGDTLHPWAVAEEGSHEVYESISDEGTRAACEGTLISIAARIAAIMDDEGAWTESEDELASEGRALSNMALMEQIKLLKLQQLAVAKSLNLGRKDGKQVD